MFKSLPKRLAVILGALSLLLPLSLATSGSASAFQPYSVSVGSSNAVAVAGCTFKVSSYNHFAGTVTGRLVGSIGPKSFASGLGIATVYLKCEVGGYSVGYYSADRVQNGSSTAFNKPVTLPYNSQFYVCVSGDTLSRGGVTSSIPINCH